VGPPLNRCVRSTIQRPGEETPQSCFPIADARQKKFNSSLVAPTFLIAKAFRQMSREALLLQFPVFFARGHQFKPNAVPKEWFSNIAASRWCNWHLRSSNAGYYRQDSGEPSSQDYLSKRQGAAALSFPKCYRPGTSDAELLPFGETVNGKTSNNGVLINDPHGRPGQRGRAAAGGVGPGSSTGFSPSSRQTLSFTPSLSSSIAARYRPFGDTSRVCGNPGGIVSW
jgi:hypothetical protein